VQAHYAGDGIHAASGSNPITLLVTPETSTVSLQPLLYGTSSAGSAAISTTSTAAGAYAVTVTATGGSTVQASTIKLTIQ
jgi:hypothetical protein